MNLHIGWWDLALFVAVALLGTTIAYIHNPKLKACMLMLPVPFTIANLSLDVRVNATHVLALVVLYIFTQGVRILYTLVGMPIFTSIVIAAVAYCGIGWGLASVMPRTEAAFWICSGCVLVIGLILQFTTRDRDEPGHRSLLPVWKKLPIITVVVTILVIIKFYLQGFMTLFPMVGVIAAYESRFSLWTTSRKIGLLMFVMLPMLAVMRITQVYFYWSITASLGLGWIAYLVMIIPLTRDVWRQNTRGDGNNLRGE